MKGINGTEMHKWATDLFPLCRSITGNGNRQTLRYLSTICEKMSIKSVPTGYKAFDWTVPEEWNIRTAWIKDDKGNTIVDFKDNNLHVVGYSIPIDTKISYDQLIDYLHSLPNQPSAIPYKTTYYNKTWGFCISEEEKLKLLSGDYHVYIDSDHSIGELNYGEIVIPGESDKEVFLSTYICHPSMANNELSGPVVAIAIAKWLTSLTNNRYTYRIIFIPETIGSLVYLSLNLPHLKQKVIAGFNISCIGDDLCYSYMPSRDGNTLSDRAAKYSLSLMDPTYLKYTWNDRGSDERQYCAPGIDLPIASIMRSKYHEYPEYHTSLDDLNFISPNGLQGGFEAIKLAIETIEQNVLPAYTILGEPMLSKIDLYPTMSKLKKYNNSRIFTDILTYSDGINDLIDISNFTSHSVSALKESFDILKDKGLIDFASNTSSKALTSFTSN